jgi:cytoskeletal protein CcmA (bactofilin family)
MAERAEALGLPMNPVPVLPPRAMPPRPADLLPQRNGASSTEAEQADSARDLHTEPRHLLVGRGVSLAGEITACARLVIEGTVEANLHDCHDIEIAETGLFKGAAAIESAEVRGRFEGDLTVRKRLLIRGTGQVSGKVAYAEIEIEGGGRLSGEISVHHGDELALDRARSRRAASAD